mmetsp:Transcript_22208/g.50774  ORF Transcript_22208/g.50774 Transcript_22208/m.50774 type:complete len:137 (-) Transcript_22208:23-433(-)
MEHMGAEEEDAHIVALRAEALLLERRLAMVVEECTEAQREAADACARRRSLAWQAESLELRCCEGRRHPAGLEAGLQRMQRERAELGARYDAEIASMRHRLATAVQVNAELRKRCQECEQEAALAQVTAATANCTS